MSKAEDYLDGLLNSLEGKGANQAPAREPVRQSSRPGPSRRQASSSPDDAFLDSFEKEFLGDDDTDDFIRQFERELDEDQDDRVPSNDAFMDSLDNIMGNVKEKMQEEEMPAPSMADDLFSEPQLQEEPSGMDDFMVDTMGDFDGLGADESSFSGLDLGADGMGDMPGLVDEEQDLMSLLQSEGDFSDIGDMLKADEENVEIPIDEGDEFGDFLKELAAGGGALPEEAAEEVSEEESPKEKKRKEKKAKRQKKEKKPKKEKDEEMSEGENSGFMKNIAQALFGSEEDEEEVVSIKSAKAAPSAGELADESAQILRELEGGADDAGQQSEGPSPEEEKERKKREKQEKKAKAKKAKKEKKEQAKKAKAQKPKKEKKPKKPKEPDNTPPLPKKPVLLIFVMAASFLVLVMVGTNYFGYAGSVARAQQAFGLGNYYEAYQEMVGMKIDENDKAFYQRCQIMANSSELYSAYRTFMENGLYDMALDSLIRTSGRCQKYAEDAKEYGCDEELESLREQAAGALGSFGLTEERALELYAIDDRQVYSAELYVVLEKAGFAVASAEN